MSDNNQVMNVVFAGLGGQGVLKASDILADAAFGADLDVKKSEIHGMSQRGGSVASDVRYGKNVLSPMVPTGEADCLVVLSMDQLERNQPMLKDGGTLVAADEIDVKELASKRCLNVALLGVLSRYLDIPEADWLRAIDANLPAKVHEMNHAAFALGRAGTKS